MRNSTGFTLIELSIVLVIIGLIVGGVLVGKDLIHASEIRATVKQVEQLDSAVNTFRLKYNCLPGDCTNTAGLGFAIPRGFDYIPNGNGDGLIDNSEALIAIDLLAQANLMGDTIGYAPGDSPLLVHPKITSTGSDNNIGGWWIQYMPSIADASVLHPGHNYWATTYVSIEAGDGNIGIFSTLDAWEMDTKLDDGLPRSGKVLAGGTGVSWDNVHGVYVSTFIPGTDDADPPAISNPSCVGSGAPDTYNVLNNAPSLCSITVGASF